MAGPAFAAAAWPVSTKIPAPIIAPTPITITSNVPRLRRSLWVSSSVLSSVSSMVLRGPRNGRAATAMAAPVPPGRVATNPGERYRPSSRLYFSR